MYDRLSRLLSAALIPLAVTPAAMAACSRDIIVPVAASGEAVTIEGGEVHGIYPDLMRSMEQKTGCHFVFSNVPRARQVALFENGNADLLLPASPTPGRDQIATFVPMVSHRTMLISVMGERAPAASMHELLERRELRLAVVRGFDYGEQYSSLLKELGKQGRLFMEVDVRAVARLLQAGSADATIMGSPLMASAVEHEPRLKGLLDKLRFDAIPELPWHPSGAYVSRKSLTPEDQRELRELLDKLAKSGAVMEGYQHRFHPRMLNGSVRAR